MASKSLPDAPIRVTSPERDWCGAWERGPVWALLRSVLAERVLIEAAYDRGGEVTVRWNANGPKVFFQVTHGIEHR